MLQLVGKSSHFCFFMHRVKLVYKTTYLNENDENLKCQNQSYQNGRYLSFPTLVCLNITKTSPGLLQPKPGAEIFLQILHDGNVVAGIKQ